MNDEQNQAFSFDAESEFSESELEGLGFLTSELSDEETERENLVSGLDEDSDLEKGAFSDPDPVNRLKRVETVMFLSRKPLTSRKISELAYLEDATQARTLMNQLNARYDRSGQAFHIKNVAGGYQMMTRPQFFEWIRRLEHLDPPIRLSSPAMETLTVVAYRQPIIKAEIEAIRGVACGEMIRQLMESNLIKIAGRSEKLGRPFLYATTKEFLTCFGLNSLQELPRARQLLGTGLPEWASSDKNLDDLKNGSSMPLTDETNKET